MSVMLNIQVQVIKIQAKAMSVGLTKIKTD